MGAAQFGDFTGRQSAIAEQSKAQADRASKDDAAILAAIREGLPSDPGGRAATLRTITEWVRQLAEARASV